MTRPAYQAYLLRLWRTSEAHWRASLEDAHSGERLTFTTLGQLSEFLLRATGAAPPAGAVDPAHAETANDLAGKHAPNAPKDGSFSSPPGQSDLG